MKHSQKRSGERIENREQIFVWLETSTGTFPHGFKILNRLDFID